MAATLIQPNEVMEIKHLCCLLFGQPGARKSSMAQTANTPITLAFDPGIYRAYGRKQAVLFDGWTDVMNFDLSPYGTIVVDTVGMALEKLSQAIIADNPKHGNRLGGLSLQGYGVLKTQFASWVSGIQKRGQDIIFIAHEKAEKSGDDTYYCPDIVGGSYTTLMTHCDIVGYLHFESGKRVLDFAPTDRWMAKSPPCNWPQMVLPDFAAEPQFLSKLLAEAKASMGQVSAASAAVASAVDEWRALVDSKPGIDELNECLGELSALTAVTKRQAWSLIKKYAKDQGWAFDEKEKTFSVPKNQEEVAT